jgi:hypothetical protein
MKESWQTFCGKAETLCTVECCKQSKVSSRLGWEPEKAVQGFNSLPEIRQCSSCFRAWGQHLSMTSHVGWIHIRTIRRLNMFLTLNRQSHSAYLTLGNNAKALCNQSSAQSSSYFLQGKLFPVSWAVTHVTRHHCPSCRSQSMSYTGINLVCTG